MIILFLLTKQNFVFIETGNLMVNLYKSQPMTKMRVQYKRSLKISLFLKRLLWILPFLIKNQSREEKHLAQIMGGKAQRIRDNVADMLVADSDTYAELLKIRDVVKDSLVSSLDDESFADMYAQTLVYGLFAARYNDLTPDDFSRSEARDLVPKTNPFLGAFFDHIAGQSFPERLRYIVDELCEVFSHADVGKILHDFL